MSILRPFCAVRPAPEYASLIAALPYDVYTSEEARVEVEKNPLSFLRIDRAETQFAPGTDPYSEKVYKKAGETISSMLSEGLFLQEEKPCYYLYTLTMDGRSQTGIVGCAAIDDYNNGGILKHENTLKEKEEDRIRHVKACQAQTGPIFLACRPTDPLTHLIDQAKLMPILYDFTSDDGIRHQVRRFDSDDQIADILHIFGEIPHLYIADGHHRAASAVHAGEEKRQENPGYTGEEEFNYFLSVVFPASELKIFDYNRIITDLNGYTFEQILAMIEDDFEVEETGSEPLRPSKKGEFGLYHAGKWYRMTLKTPETGANPSESLDVSVLQRKVLERIFCISDPKSDPRIRFLGGIRGLYQLQEKADAFGGIAFSMYPTSMEELFLVADAGLLMPPKSTWFEPKLRSGLFIHRF